MGMKFRNRMKKILTEALVAGLLLVPAALPYTGLFLCSIFPSFSRRNPAGWVVWLSPLPFIALSCIGFKYPPVLSIKKNQFVMMR